jgi:hypothetical protein
VTALAAGPVQDALSDVARFVPKFLAFLVILLVGWVVARLLRSVVGRVLKRVGFDRAVERGGVGRLLARTRYDAVGLMSALVYYAVLLFTLQLAFGIWGPNRVSDLIEGIVAWLPRAFVAIVIIVVAAAIAAGVRNLIVAALGGLSYGRLLAGVVGAFIVGLGIIAALNQVGVATSVTTPVLIATLATIAGILVVGVGGGLVRPMQSRWESWLDQAEREIPRVRDRMRAATEERESQAREAAAREAAEREETARREAAEREEAARREAAERAAAERAAAERAAAEREEAARREAAEQAERERAERERLEQERLERERVERELAEREERERVERERAEAARAAEIAREEAAERQREAERQQAEREEAARAEAAREEAERAEQADRPRTARERAEQAATHRAAAAAGTLPQAPPSDEPTIAISTEAVRAAAAGRDRTDADTDQDADRTQVIEWPAGAASDEEESVRTQVLPVAEPEQPAPPTTPKRRGRGGGRK